MTLNGEVAIFALFFTEFGNFKQWRHRTTGGPWTYVDTLGPNLSWALAGYHT